MRKLIPTFGLILYFITMQCIFLDKKKAGESLFPFEQKGIGLVLWTMEDRIRFMIKFSISVSLTDLQGTFQYNYRKETCVVVQLFKLNNTTISLSVCSV